MRIDDRNLSGNQAAQTGKTDQAQELARLAESKARDTQGAAGADRVELSDLTGGLARALEADASQRRARVEGLAADYAAGRYQVDARAVSQAIIAETLAAG
jgi:anti-sigma28 factor (negative regulator of flagellin synthesis)